MLNILKKYVQAFRYKNVESGHDSIFLSIVAIGLFLILLIGTFYNLLGQLWVKVALLISVLFTAYFYLDIIYKFFDKSKKKYHSFSLISHYFKCYLLLAFPLNFIIFAASDAMGIDNTYILIATNFILLTPFIIIGIFKAVFLRKYS